MNSEHCSHLADNITSFDEKYTAKYIGGQREHGGDMWTMGAYQALEQMEAEVLDQWSYVRQIRKCLDEITYACDVKDDPAYTVLEILDRIKPDGK
jgi:hypothetical protein